MYKKYAFRRYSSIYRKIFDLERRRLLRSLSKTVCIEHVGSTAVPGLGGKNIVDIAVGSGSSLAGVKPKLEGLGYEFRERAGTRTRLFFKRYRTYRGKKVTVHLHLTSLGGKEWNEFIAFRDYLAGHKPSFLEYAKIKKNAVEFARGDREAYIRAKDGFIRRTTKLALEGR